MPMDMRDYLGKLDELGELKVIDQEVDWNLEAAAITTMADRTGEKVPLFRKIRGYPHGFTLAGDPYTGTWKMPWRRFAIAFGMSPDVSWDGFCAEIAKRLAPIKPMVVSDGPCKEVVKVGKDANLFDLPWPYVHEGDGGRYATLQNIIAKDYDTDWINWANYRMVVHNRNKIGIPLQYGQQTANIFYHKYEPHGKAMPVAIAIGGDPLVNVASGMPFPPGVNEIDFAGGFRGEPINLVKAETVNLYVPADAEIVIEGELRPQERADEGPFGEYVGYMHGPRRPMPVMRVNCITHRKNPIIPFTVEGLRDAVTSSSSVVTTIISVALYLTLRFQRGLPVSSVAMSTILPWSALIVATKVPYPGYLEKVARWLFHIGVMTYPDFIIFVDDDVDPTNNEEVLEEIALKTHPGRDYHDFHKPQGAKSHLNVYQHPSEKGVALTSKVWIDATTKKWDSARGPRRMGFKEVYPQDLREWTAQNWAALGFTHDIVEK